MCRPPRPFGLASFRVLESLSDQATWFDFLAAGSGDVDELSTNEVVMSASKSSSFLTTNCFFRSTGSAATLDLGFNIPPPIKTVTVEGSRLLIPCEPIRGEKGLPNVTWTNEESLVNEPRRHVLTNGTLLITEVRASDAGQYRCVLRQGTRAVLSAPAGLVLADTGSWQMLPRNSSVRPNSAVRLTCHLPSIPPAALTWLVDGETLERGRSRWVKGQDVQIFPFLCLKQTSGIKSMTDIKGADLWERRGCSFTSANSSSFTHRRLLPPVTRPSGDPNKAGIY
nr:protogenin A-like [Penaeus vannamei]